MGTVILVTSQVAVGFHASPSNNLFYELGYHLPPILLVPLPLDHDGGDDEDGPRRVGGDSYVSFSLLNPWLGLHSSMYNPFSHPFPLHD